MKLDVICLKEDAFYSLIEEVVDRIKTKENKNIAKWIKDNEAMELLGIKSKTTMQNLRNNGDIKFSQPTKKNILYDRESIEDFIETKSFSKF